MKQYPDLAFLDDPAIAGFKKPRIGFRGPMGEQYIYDAEA